MWEYVHIDQGHKRLLLSFSYQARRNRRRSKAYFQFCDASKAEIKAIAQKCCSLLQPCAGDTFSSDLDVEPYSELSLDTSARSSSRQGSRALSLAGRVTTMAMHLPLNSYHYCNGPVAPESHCLHAHRTKSKRNSTYFTLARAWRCHSCTRASLAVNSCSGWITLCHYSALDRSRMMIFDWKRTQQYLRKAYDQPPIVFGVQEMEMG